MISQFPGLNFNLVLCVGVALLLSSIRNEDPRVRLAFSGLAVYLNGRYLSWRVSDTIGPFELSFEALWQYGFLLAETIAVLLLSWHLLLLAFGPRRAEVPQLDEARWQGPDGAPPVDVFIPTVDEPAAMLERTIAAAAALDYPQVTVWVLDDGGREWLADLCHSRGVRYLARGDRGGFKAGNLNHGLTQSSGQYVLCLDADFVVKPNFLRCTLGYFQDPRIAIVQTPQHFSNPDAIQHALGGRGAWPEEQRVFSDCIQPSRDRFDNAFCYGSNFVIRREALDAVGGFPEQTICEDLFLSYLLKQQGWITRYHDEALAVGRAADRLDEFIKQRVRWCTGTLQCLFSKGGPLWSRNLTILDRAFYLDPVLYYLSSIWAFWILVAPAVFWWTGVAPFHSDHGHLMMMMMPRMMVSMIVLYWHSDQKVVPFVSEIGRNVGIFHFLAAILATVVQPFSRGFEVTDKSSERRTTIVNVGVMTPHLILLAITLGGIVVNGSRHAVLDTGWNEDLGLIIALTVYFLWVNFLSILACIEPPLEIGEGQPPRPLVAEGSLFRSVAALGGAVIR